MPSFKEGDENAEDFLADFESILIANNLTPDEHWKRLLVACMKGSHKQWANNAVRDYSSWEELKKGFIRELGDVLRLDHLIDRLHTLRPRNGERAFQFCQRFRSLALQTEKPEDDEYIVSWFMKAVSPATRIAIQQDMRSGTLPQSPSLKELYNTLRDFPDLTESNSTRRASSSSRTLRSSGQFCEYHQTTTHSTANCIALKRKTGRQQGQQQRPKSQGSSNKPYSRPPSATNTPTCYNCGKVGHLSRNCRLPSRSFMKSPPEGPHLRVTELREEEPAEPSEETEGIEL